MLPGEASQSRGASTSRSSAVKKIKINTSKIDGIFPLFDQLSEKVNMNPILINILSLYTMCQIIITCFWCENYQYSFLIRLIIFIDFDLYFIQFLVFTVYVAILIILLLYQMVSFAKTRKSNLHVLNLLSFFAEYFPIVMLHPICILIGNISYDLFTGQITGIMVLILFFTILYLMIVVGFYTTTSVIRQCSAYLDQTPFSTLDHTLLTLMIISSSLLNIGRILIGAFPEWTVMFVISIHLACFVVCFIKMYYYPFFYCYTNIAIWTLLITCILLDIYRILTLAIDDKFEYEIILYIVAGLLAISGIVSYVIYFIRQKKVKNLLLDDKVENGIFEIDARNSKRALYLLHYAIEYMAPCFRDFTFARFLIRTYTDDTKMVSKLLKILTLFPDKQRELQPLYEAIYRKRSLSIFDRFLVYQVVRIRALRQSSSSMQATTIVTQLKFLSRHCEDTVISFWNAKDLNSNDLYSYSVFVKKVRSMWEENLRNFPNNILFRDEFAQFLIEAATDFKSAIVETHHSAMIESGKSYSVDFCFRSFIRMFPMVLKRRVIDLKGNFISNRGKKSSSQNSSNNLSSTGSSGLDAKMEEDIGKAIINQFKIRLALQKLADSRKPNTYNAAVSMILISLVFGLGMLVATYEIFINYFEGRYDDTLRSINFNICRTELVTIYLFTVLKWATEIPIPRFIRDKFRFPDEDLIESTSMIRGLGFSEMCIVHNTIARENYNQFLFDIVDGSKRGEDVFAMAPRLFEDLVDLTYCKGGDPILPPIKTDFKSALTYNYFLTKLLASKAADMTWFTSERYMCNIFSNRQSFANAFTILRSNLVDGQIAKAFRVEKFILTLRILMSVLMFLLNFFPSLVVVIFFIKEINHFAKLMIMSEPKFKRDAQGKLAKKPQIIQVANVSEIKSSKDVKPIIFLILFLLIDFTMSAFLYIIVTDATSMNHQYENIATWSFKSSVRIPNAFDSLTSIFISILLTGSNKMITNFTTVEREIDFVHNQIVIIEQYRDDLLTNDDGFPPILGFDPTIDYLMLSETCVANITSGDLHEYYACGSANQVMTVFENLITEILSDVNEMNSTLDNYHCATLLHILCYHIQPVLEKINSRIDILVNNMLKMYVRQLTIYLIVGLVVIAIRTALSLIYLNILMYSYKGGLMMLKRLSPIGIFANTQLFSYLLNRKSEKAINDQNVSKSIINTSSDCIMCLGNSGTIEIINPAIQMTFGYTPEQLLGQSFTVIFEDKAIQNQLDLMASGQSGKSYEGNASCITDSEQNVSCSITLFRITDDNSFVLIIRDEHELFTRMAEAEEAKKKSEDLLYQILPRDIVNRLNQGEKDISFQVPSATICFIDVVKFSEYAASLSPEMIMGNLSIMFAGFDECLNKYKTLTKIKLIGDVYMCAAGLFSPDVEPKTHAEEMIRFSLDALSSLEETCNRLNAMLNVRIGVNTGGPLIAGVLGSDKPVFDIIGDPINIASRLQSTDVAGLIQISQSTYELVQSLDFNIEARGEIFLKGKGKSLAYLIKPTSPFHLLDQNC